MSTSVENTPTQAPPGSWTPARGERPTGLTDAQVITFAIASCEALIENQTFGPLTRLIDVRRDVPPEVRDGEEADYKSAVFTVTSCLAHTVGLRPLPRDLELLLRQGMDVYPGHRPGPELLANEMRRAAMRLSIAVPDSTIKSPMVVPAPEPVVAPEVQPPPAAPPAAAPSPTPVPGPVSAPASAPRKPRRRLFAAMLAVAVTAGALSYAVDRSLDGSSEDNPATATRATNAPRATNAAGATVAPAAEANGATGATSAKGTTAVTTADSAAGATSAVGAAGATGAELHVARIAVEAGPNGQTQVRVAPAIDSKVPVAMTLPFGPGARLMLLTDPLPAAWQPSVAPKSQPTELGLDRSTLGSTGSGPVTAVPPNPVSSPSTFTGGDGKEHQTLVSTMKDRDLAAGATLPNHAADDVLVYDVPLGTTVLGFALVGDDGSIIATTPRSSFPTPTDASSF